MWSCSETPGRQVELSGRPKTRTNQNKGGKNGSRAPLIMGSSKSSCVQQTEEQQEKGRGKEKTMQKKVITVYGSLGAKFSPSGRGERRTAKLD